MIDDTYFEDLFENPPIDVASEYSVYEGNEIVKNGDATTQPGTQPAPVGSMKSILDAQDWLPYSADWLNISPNFADYIIVPVEIIISDLPNRNGVAFPGEELLRVLPRDGRRSYETWERKPVCLEHKNNIEKGDPAKGVIISTALRQMTTATAPFMRLMHLLAIDRQKDPWLANEILTRKRTGYSMGSSCATYTCSICSADMRENGGRCSHIDVTSSEAKYRSLKVVNGQLAFPQSRYFFGIECSSVSNPAGAFAKTENILRG